MKKWKYFNEKLGMKWFLNKSLDDPKRKQNDFLFGKLGRKYYIHNLIILCSLRYQLISSDFFS